MSALSRIPSASALPRWLRERLLDLGRSDDVDLGVRLLRGTPTNEAREDAVLEHVSRAAQQFGHDLAADRNPVVTGITTQIRERDDGLISGTPAVARFLPRQGRVELFTDVIEHCEAVVEALGWKPLFPPGSIREAALLHERAHELIGHERTRDLRRAVGVPAMRLGRYVRWAHVAGADELAAHAYAQSRLGLSRSPLLVTVAAMAALDEASSATDTSLKED
ncbi:hypothetical protein [Brachybacterium alimentarium]|uniref:hypothetical protein n=1 Tax=Brachybacterium alimentarium TaxID=47845 RepID=UPI001C69D731|nr:hypothetical protein [Brachybacterium alimentarium]